MGTKTDMLVEQLVDTHKCLRDGSSRSGMSAQDRVLLERQITKLEGSVADLTGQLDEKGVAYIKKDSMFTMAARQSMSQLVTQQSTTFNSAYQDVRTLERARRHLQEVGVAKTKTLNKNS